MSGTRKVAGLAMVAALCLIQGNGLSALAQTQAPAAGAQDAGAGKPPQYTMAEYNAFQAAKAETNPAQQVKLLDDFLSKYPNSALLIYIYPLYMQSYGQLKDYPKVIIYSDKLAQLNDKNVDAATRFNAYYTHAIAYTTLISADKTAAKDAALAKSAQDAVTSALKTLDEVKKPDGVADDAWATQTKTFRMTLNSIGAQAASVQKDWPSAIGFYKAYLALNPDEAITNYNVGRAYLALTPPQTMDGFWYVARGAASKNATQAQSKQLKDYLRKLMQNYQQATCDSLVDAQLNELLQLAAGSADRPTSYNLPSAADLTTAQKDMTILSVINDLKAGGDKAKLTWLASCGSEFPGVPGKVIEVTPGATDSDPIVFKIAFVTSDAEFDAATVPNMDLKVIGQPEAKRVEKDSAIHFTGTLTSYDPDPTFMLHWEKGKVNEEDIPKEKAAPKKGVKKKPAAQ
jgi:tetratricopeptide (TPR) repeat protein